MQGSLSEAVEDAAVFVGVSAANVLTSDIVKKMKKKPIVFALANPEPEILPEIAQKAGIEIIATGRSDYPNQVNNVLAFPGVFRGALDCCARDINIEMKLAAAKALASIVEKEVRTDYIIPKPFDDRVLPAVATAVATAAVKTEFASKDTDLDWIEYRAKTILRK